MESSKSLTQLEQEIKKVKATVGEPTGANGKFLKRDYVIALSLHYLLEKYGELGKVPQNIRARLSFDSPQLLYNYFDLREEQKEDVWNSENVCLVEKINGYRITLVYSQKEKYSFFSREIHEVDYMYLEYSHRLGVGCGELNCNAILDLELQIGNTEVFKRLKEMGCEVSSQQTSVISLLSLDTERYNTVVQGLTGVWKYKLIDVYNYNGMSLRNTAYKNRRDVFDTVCMDLTKAGITTERPMWCDNVETKKAFHEGLLKSGAEGTVAVFMDKGCSLDGSRKRDTMLKIKASLFAHLFDKTIMTDTVDGWVDDITLHGNIDEHVVHTIRVCAYDKNGESVVIAVTEAIPLSLRKLIQMGDVVTLSGERWINGKVTEAIVEEIRYDKQSHSCILNF